MVRCAASAAWSEFGETLASAKVTTALTTKSNGKSRCHMRGIVAGIPSESQADVSGWEPHVGPDLQWASGYLTK